MSDLRIVEIKAFIPSKDFELSKSFYSDIGFELKSSDENIAYFAFDKVSFLLQNFYIKEHADNFMMHLLVEDVDSWWQKINDSGVEQKYSIKLGKPEDQPWKMRDFVFTDVSGVLWRIGQNL